MTGQLVLVSTPIGNLGDLPPRAVETLRGVRADLLRGHAPQRQAALARRRQRRAPGRRQRAHRSWPAPTRCSACWPPGSDVAVVTDAGTPGHQRPRRRLVRAAVEAGYVGHRRARPGRAGDGAGDQRLRQHPLRVRGFPAPQRPRTHRAHRRGRRRAAHHRALRSTPPRAAHRRRPGAPRAAPTVASRSTRELTKLHEEVWRGTLAEAAVHLAERAPRGEYVVVLEGAPLAAAADDDAVAGRVTHGTCGRCRSTDGNRYGDGDTGAAKRRVYDLALTIPR